jgi:hypothetical protein
MTVIPCFEATLWSFQTNHRRLPRFGFERSITLKNRSHRLPHGVGVHWGQFWAFGIPACRSTFHLVVGVSNQLSSRVVVIVDLVDIPLVRHLPCLSRARPPDVVDLTSSSSIARSRSRRLAVVVDQGSSSILSRCLALLVFGCTRAPLLASSFVSSYAVLLARFSFGLSFSPMILIFLNCESKPGFGILLSALLSLSLSLSRPRISGGGFEGTGGDSGRGCGSRCRATGCVC